MTTTIEGCAIHIQGDARAVNGNLVHLRVRVVQRVDLASAPRSVVNEVSVATTSGQTATGRLELPVRLPAAPAGTAVAGGAPTAGGVAGVSITIPAGTQV